jgi:F-type H+-transporting ATPase subunit gamma
LIKKGLEFLRENSDRPGGTDHRGPKARDYFRRSTPGSHEYVGIFNQLTYTQAEVIGQDAIRFFVQGRAKDVTLVYTEFKSAIQQNVVTTRCCP